jgi:hypothetical protein
MLKNQNKAPNSQKQAPKNNQNNKTNQETTQQAFSPDREGGHNRLSSYTPQEPSETVCNKAGEQNSKLQPENQLHRWLAP